MSKDSLNKNKLNVSVSDVKHIEIPGVSVYYATVYINGKKQRKAFVNTSKKFKQSLKAKIMEYCKNRQKGC